LCEKLGIIPSAEEIIAIRDIRNIIAHEYLSENLVEIYMEIFNFIHFISSDLWFKNLSIIL